MEIQPKSFTERHFVQPVKGCGKNKSNRLEGRFGTRYQGILM